MGRGINVWTCSDTAPNAYEMESWKEINTTLLFPPYLTFIPLPWSHFSRYSCTRWLVMILHTDCLQSDHISNISGCLHGAEVLSCGASNHQPQLQCTDTISKLLEVYAHVGRLCLVGTQSRQLGWFSSKAEGVCSFLSHASRVTFRDGQNIDTVRSMKC